MTADLRALGRGIVVSTDAEAPGEYAHVARLVVNDEVLAAPGPAADVLHRHWLARQPVVVELDAPAAELRAPEVDHREPWELGESFEFARERLQFLVWANNWDARSEAPKWWWTVKGGRLGATPGGPADVVLADGTPAFVDGGPRGPVDASAAVVHRESLELGSLRVARHRDAVAELAPDQLAAVSHGSGAARVIAPAGSGKTRVLTERLRHLLADEGWEPSLVTAVAFNKRAADELTARTSGLRAHVRTINALGLAVLTGSLGGQPPARRPAVIDESEVRRILDGLIEVRRQANTDALAPYLEGLSAIRLGLRSPTEVEAALPDATGLADLWPRYRDALDRAGVVDFDDQIDRAIRLLLTDPALRAAAQARCRHLLVDEFQDLTPAHLLLLRLLAAPAYDVFGVGDDDQVIYGYAGATPTYLIDFERWFPGARSHALEVNYRCPTTVVDAARHLLAYNLRRIDKTIRAPATAPAGVLDIRRVPSTDLAACAVEVVGSALADGRAAGEIAVLARVNSALLPVQIALEEAGIPTTSPLDRRILERTGIRTTLAWLRVGADPTTISRADVLATVRRPSRRISRNVVDMLTKRSTTSLTDIRRLASRLSGGDVDKLEGYADAIEAVRRAVPAGTVQALATIRGTVGLAQAMDVLDTSRSEADRSSHGDDLRALEQVAALHPDAATFGTWLADRLGRTGSGPSSSDGSGEGGAGGTGDVTLSTVHRVKGQEWPVVVVFGADEEAFPHRLATDVEEERRVFHVALTRACAAAVVIADRSAPSPFLAELDGGRARVALTGRRAGGPDTAGAGDAAATAGGGAGGGRRGRGGGGGEAGQPRDTAGVGTEEAVDPALWDALRSWRRDAAGRTNAPAYVVLSDADLRGVALRMPANLAELARCRGFGPTKLERYGDELLALLDSLRGDRS